MDTRMLDVAIGLVLTIALLSLVATAAREAFAGMRNSRGRTLSRLVCSLAGDNRALSQEILSHPFIQSMAMELPDHKHQRNPSYLASDVFVTGLLDFLTRYTGNVRPASPAVLVQELRLRMTQDKDQKFCTSLASLLPGAENDWPVFEKRLQAWFDAVGERSSGWYKRENQVSLFVIGFLLALLINVNPVVISRALWNDAALRKSAVEQAELALQAYRAGDGTGAASPRSAAATGAGTLAGALNRETDRALNTIHEVFRAAVGLTTDKQLKDGANPAAPVMTVLAMRKALELERAGTGGDARQAAQHDAAAASFDFSLGQLRRQVPEGAGAAKDCGTTGYLPCHAVRQLDTALGKLKESIDAERGVRDPRKGDQVAAAILTGQCASIEKQASPATNALCARLRELGIFMPAAMPIGWSAATWPAVFGKCKSPPDAAAGDCAPWGLASWPDAGNWIIALVGWLLTALGVTLGAPFWFDLLDKLMKVRSSGLKPVEGSEAVTGGAVPAAAPSTLTPSLEAVGVGGRPGPEDALNDAERALSEDEITHIQRSLGVEPTGQTGRLDLSTRSAITVWQTRYGAAATGELTLAQIQQLLSNPITLEDDGYVG